MQVKPVLATFGDESPFGIKISALESSIQKSPSMKKIRNSHEQQMYHFFLIQYSLQTMPGHSFVRITMVLGELCLP